MTNKYKIDFNNNIPTWNELLNLGVNLAYPKININMNIYDKDELIFSLKLYIEGIYSCSGSVNFEFDKVKLDIIKDCDNETKDLIINEIQTKYDDIKNMLKGTILDIWNIRIYDYICESLY